MKGLVASPLGALIGFLMGAFGGGGSLIAIPVLVYLVDQPVRDAQATALVVVIAAAVTGLIAHVRAGGVRWRMGIAFGLAAGASALAASIVTRDVNPDALLLAFSPVMLAGAGAMVSERARAPASFTPWRYGVHPGEVARVVGLGLLVGCVIGVFGVGGGFVIVPALVLVLHVGMVEAIGTSLLVVTIAAAFALGERIGAGDVDWAVAIPFSAAALLGALVGQRLAERIATERLQTAFAAVIVLAAIYTAVRSAAAL